MSRPEVTQAVADLGRTLDSLAAAQSGWSGPVAVAPDAPGRSPASAGSQAVDWSLVVVLRRRASEEITAASQRWGGEHGAAMDREDRRMMGRSVIRQVVRHHAEELARRGQAPWSLEQEQACAAAVENAIFGYGRLQPLFEIPAAENIEIHGWDSVVVQYGDGRREEHPPVADSDEELVEAIRFLGESASPSRPFDDAHPMMTLALGDRFRLHAIGFGLSYRPSIVIRQHILTDVSLRQLADGGMMPAPVAALLHDAVLGRRSMVISGDQGAGKTTLLRALIDAIPHTERFGTLETDYELLTHLQPGRRNMLALQARSGMGERAADGSRAGEFTVTDLLPEALRQNLSRLVVGEVRGGEAAAMFEAMQSGAGALCTTHSHSASSTMDRLASRVAQGGVLGMEEAYRQIAHNIHLLVHVCLVDDTWRGGTRRRHIAEIRSLTGGIESGRPVTHLVYRAATPTEPMVWHPDPQLVEGLAEFAGSFEASS
ncbi:CpaF/VirB11 family protein [Luteococcus peritonei]|uniref:CpaF/VirB11 family protein n=1 Tax=Luteococcus peritonei TaxID=88874 RepID=A0ABW4RTB3_9ACTN